MNKQKRTSSRKELPYKKPITRNTTNLPKGKAGRAPDNTRSISKNFKHVIPVVFTMKVPTDLPTMGSGTVRTGRVNFFNAEKGYGFIKDHITQESYFVYEGSLHEPISANDIVSFEIEKTPGGLTAVKVYRIVLPPSSN